MTDEIFLGLAQRHGSVEELLETFFSFFERRTDLFHIMDKEQDKMGFTFGTAERMVNGVFRRFQHKYLERNQPHYLEAVRKVREDAAKAAKLLPREAPKVAPAPAPVQAPVTPVPAAVTPKDSAKATEAARDSEAVKKAQHISTWNGAVTNQYRWSQSLSDITIEFTVDRCNAKDIDVKLTAHDILIKVRGEEFFSGKFHERISLEDSTWILEEKTRIVLSLDKGRHTWWSCFCQGNEEIDTTKIESTKHMSEYSEETQGTIRKIMFDQNQKHLGKPTSDQIRTADMMKDAWDAEGSPFKGMPFDPSLLNIQGTLP